MSGVREIRFTIDKKTGEMKSETIGFKGSSCEQILDEISNEMKAKIIDKKNKPERFQPLSDAEAQKEKQALKK
jgi:hypothetical protein